MYLHIENLHLSNDWYKCFDCYSFNFVVRLVCKNTNSKCKNRVIKTCVLHHQNLMKSKSANALPYQLTSGNPVNLFWLCLLHLTIAWKVRTISLFIVSIVTRKLLYIIVTIWLQNCFHSNSVICQDRTHVLQTHHLLQYTPNLP